MNLHITDTELFENLKKASIASCEFGSTLYKTNDELSDVDIHYVYATSVNESQSFLKSHHHLQFKEENTDHIFVNLHTFLTNLIKGDSTVLFEIVHSGKFIGTPLEFLYNMRDSFINYSIIRSYCGFARRDIQHYSKKKTHREQLKALAHIFRGYYFAKSLLDGNFQLVNEEFLELVKDIRTIEENDYKAKKDFLNKGQNLVTNLREGLNLALNNNTLSIPKFMSVEEQAKLDCEIKNLAFSWEWNYCQSFLKNFDMTPFYNAFENEINYEN